MYKWRVALQGVLPNVVIDTNVIPKAGKAYVFKGFAEIVDNTPHFIALVEWCDKSTYRVIEGNPHAFRESAEALKNPETITPAA
jgi:hypothetical protein